MKSPKPSPQYISVRSYKNYDRGGFQYAECKFNLYILNTQKNHGSKDNGSKESKESRVGNGIRQRRDLLPLLQEAEDYVNTAIQLTQKDDNHFHQLALQYRLLGYIHSQRCSIQRSTEKQVTFC